MQTKEIRAKFLSYFNQYNHQIVKSSSLIPVNDPTLLFTNAGMNQFKDVFLGLDKPHYNRATSTQKCVRAGGKHNDLENVGYTGHHHTFFEMLGNFSFGDYFKLEAIKFAWEFLTITLAINPNKLYVTVYHTDDESYNIWQDTIGLAPDRIIKIGDNANGGSDNFWQMGDTGPCGPCTEIFYDHGETVAGGLPGSNDADGDRYIEVWNCVFMQYNRDERLILHPLPKPSVDTGMGLERISAVMQNVHSNYEIDLFKALIASASQITKCGDLLNPSLKVLADHIRSISFLIADGVLPSNEGRGYVLRRIIRRAIRHGYKLGMRQTFLYLLVNELVIQMGDVYSELTINQANIENIIRHEEEKFFQTIDNGMRLLHDTLSKLSGTKLSGETAFKLYDTYGFPLDLTQDVCREVGVEVDHTEFDKAMNIQKNQAQKAGKFKMDMQFDYSGDATEFLGYTKTSINDVEIIALYDNNHKPVNKLVTGEQGVVLLNKTVFYAQGGGQVGDSGVIESVGKNQVTFNVTDTQKIHADVVGHLGTVTIGTLSVGDIVNASYDTHTRMATTRNHSATHLLHKALQEVIGKHATQKGSLVCKDYTRFDYAHDKPLTNNECQKIEQIVNHVIMMNYLVKHENIPYDDAINKGAMALFGEKYTDVVRVISMGDFSTELCGGTHVMRTGDIGFFTITSESGVASGVRRIEAITGEVALARMQKNMAIFDQLRLTLKAQTNDIILDKMVAWQNEVKNLTKELNDCKAKLVSFQIDGLINQTIILTNGIKSLVLEIEYIDNKLLFDMMDKLKNKLGSGIITIGCKSKDKVILMVGVTNDLVDKYKAGNLVGSIAPIVGGKGGGRADLAQAGGTIVSKLPDALGMINDIILSISIDE